MPALKQRRYQPLLASIITCLLKRIILITPSFHQLRTYLTFARVFHPYGIEILNYSADPVRLKCIST